MFEEQGAHGQRHKTARPVGTWSRGKRQSAGKCNLIKPAAEEMALASGREAVTSGKTIRRRKRERTNRSGEQINRKDTWKLAMKGRSILWTKITPLSQSIESIFSEEGCATIWAA